MAKIVLLISSTFVIFISMALILLGIDTFRMIARMPVEEAENERAIAKARREQEGN